MHKLSFSTSTLFKDLPVSSFDKAPYSVYVIDFDWNYLFVNKFVAKNLGRKGVHLEGKNIWKTFPELAMDFSFQGMKKRAEKGLESDFVTISPITSQKLNITGKRLKDCYLFTSSIMPKKEDLMADLKATLKRSN
jgi:hypothetical protein